MTEQIRETVTALRNARAAGDEYAVGVLSGRLARQVAAYRDGVLTQLEGLCDQLQEAEARGDAGEAAGLFPGFERALRQYECLCDWSYPGLVDSSSLSGDVFGGCAPFIVTGAQVAQG